MAGLKTQIIDGKPLGRKAYGSIPHLPNSRRGSGDHGINSAQAAMLTDKSRDSADRVIVTEKLDGSNVAVARVGGVIVALNRAGYDARTSPYAQHRMFADWVDDHADRFGEWLAEGDWVSGEWLAQAHGTRYDLTSRDPFVVFDLWRGGKRALHSEMCSVCADAWLQTVPVLHSGSACPVELAMALLGERGHYGALDEAEGAVWRMERKGRVEFLAKYVRPDKVDGKLLPFVSGGDPVWNWIHPQWVDRDLNCDLTRLEQP